MALKNEIGNTYTYLTVIERAENTKEGRARWLCQCKCGNMVIVLGKHLPSFFKTKWFAVPSYFVLPRSRCDDFLPSAR